MGAQMGGWTESASINIPALCFSDTNTYYCNAAGVLEKWIHQCSTVYLHSPISRFYKFHRSEPVIITAHVNYQSHLPCHVFNISDMVKVLKERIMA